MNIYGQDFVSTSGGFNLGDWGQFQVVYQDAGGGVYYPPTTYPGGYPGYGYSSINWTTILILLLIAVVVFKVLK